MLLFEGTSDVDSELQICVINSWSPTIGDPSVVGWVTVVAYAATAILSALVIVLKAANRRTFWAFMAIILALLAVNKQLDLQSALTAIGRCHAQLYGWYEDRRTFQVAFIVLFSSIALSVALFVAWNMRRGLKRIWLALVGFTLLGTFVVVRAAGFHNVDMFIGFDVFGVRVNWLMELTGIVLIGLNAVILIAGGPAPPRKRRKVSDKQSGLPLRRDFSR